MEAYPMNACEMTNLPQILRLMRDAIRLGAHGRHIEMNAKLEDSIALIDGLAVDDKPPTEQSPPSDGEDAFVERIIERHKWGEPVPAYEADLREAYRAGVEAGKRESLAREEREKAPATPAPLTQAEYEAKRKELTARLDSYRNTAVPYDALVGAAILKERDALDAAWQKQQPTEEKEDDEDIVNHIIKHLYPEVVFGRASTGLKQVGTRSLARGRELGAAAERERIKAEAKQLIKEWNSFGIAHVKAFAARLLEDEHA